MNSEVIHKKKKQWEWPVIGRAHYISRRKRPKFSDVAKAAFHFSYVQKQTEKMAWSSKISFLRADHRNDPFFTMTKRYIFETFACIYETERANMTENVSVKALVGNLDVIS